MVINPLTRNITIMIKYVFNFDGCLFGDPTANNIIISKDKTWDIRAFHIKSKVYVRMRMKTREVNVTTKVFCTYNEDIVRDMVNCLIPLSG